MSNDIVTNRDRSGSLSSKSVFRVLYPLPHVSADAGDHVIVDPDHPTAPVRVVKHFGREELNRLIREGHLERMNPLLATQAGKPPKLAFIALARKLLTILNAMVRDRTTWRKATA